MQPSIKCEAGCTAGAVVILSAYFAGTTLGIFTLDRVGLQILSQASADAEERKRASTYTPSRLHVSLAVRAQAAASSDALKQRIIAAECAVHLQKSYCL